MRGILSGLGLFGPDGSRRGFTGDRERNMTRMTAVICLVASLAASAPGDRLELLDARTFEGQVTVEGDTVTIKMTYGTLQFAQRDVARIMYMDTPEDTLAKKILAASPTDPDALFAVAKWAIDNGLDRQAKGVLTKIITLDADHGEARRYLLQARINGKWQSIEDAMELVRSKLQAQRHQDVLTKVLPALKDLPLSAAQHTVMDELRARAQLQAGRFVEARGTFSDLAGRAGGDAAIKYGAIASILTEYGDGMYLVAGVYPPQAGLIRPKGQVLEPGPASLRREIVLDAALHDVARTTELETGKKLLADARKLEPTDPDTARTKYALASRCFRRADAIVTDTRTPGIAKTYHVEVARCRIRAIRAIVEADAGEYEKIVATLGAAEMSDKEYRTLVLRMMHQLGSAQDGLKEVLTLAKPYPHELILEIKWAEVDLKKIDSTRKALAGELDNGK